MKRNFTILICVGFILLASPTLTLHAQQTFRTTTETVIGLLEYLPQDYNNNSNKYPLVIFLHGIGERGANSTDPSVLQGTIEKVDNIGPPRHVLDGHHFPFILISPQLKNNYGNWPMWYVMEVINWAKNTYRVDEKKIHITGLSLGGGGTWTAAQDYPTFFASASPICGGYNSPSKACSIAAENLPIWTFHGDADTTVPLSKTSTMVNAINACSPTPNPKAKLTVYPGVKHDAWVRAYKPDYTYHNPNIYEWMMAQTNTKNGGNSIPTANAGSDKTHSGVTSITLSGSGTDPDGSIRSYQWTKMSGPAATIANASAASTSVAVTKGTYMFRLTVTDNSGNTDSDYVKIVISSTTVTNSPPTVDAGADITMTLPASTARLSGRASDTDGSIASYQWTKVSGGVANLSNDNTAELTAWGLAEGTYVFRLTVKDDKGASVYDDAKVTVNKGTGNAAPTANAGADVTLIMPASTARLYGKGTDSDGTISAYSWTKVSGGTANMSNAETPDLTAWGLTEGTYVFRLTVKDNAGATGYDDVTVVVSNGQTGRVGNQSPIVNAGADVTINLPATTARLYGSASDPDGTIKSYSWTKISGGAANLSDAETPSLIAWKLVAGTYVFRLTVTDSGGETAYDDVKVVVK